MLLGAQRLDFRAVGERVGSQGQGWSAIFHSKFIDLKVIFTASIQISWEVFAKLLERRKLEWIANFSRPLPSPFVL
jgi:hypothetical protein